MTEADIVQTRWTCSYCMLMRGHQNMKYKDETNVTGSETSMGWTRTRRAPLDYRTGPDRTGLEAAAALERDCMMYGLETSGLYDSHEDTDISHQGRAFCAMMDMRSAGLNGFTGSHAIREAGCSARVNSGRKGCIQMYQGYSYTSHHLPNLSTLPPTASTRIPA